MQGHYNPPPSLSTRSLGEGLDAVEIIGGYVPLRRSGQQYFGHCPFHEENTPSFAVNAEKQVFYCYGCHEGGDVITFIQKIEGLDFKAALNFLHISSQPLPPAEISRRKQLKAASESLSSWALDISLKINWRLRELGDREYIAKKILRELPEADEELLRDEIDTCCNEWARLEDLQERVIDLALTLDLWRHRKEIEAIIGDGAESFPTTEELNSFYLPMTARCRQQPEFSTAEASA
jgi:DNA primase